MPSKHGFTLFELMIVVAMVAILNALAIPIYMNYTTQARSQVIKGYVTDFETALNNFATQNSGRLFPEVGDSSFQNDGVYDYTPGIATNELNYLGIQRTAEEMESDNLLGITYSVTSATQNCAAYQAPGLTPADGPFCYQITLSANAEKGKRILEKLSGSTADNLTFNCFGPAQLVTNQFTCRERMKPL